MKKFLCILLTLAALLAVCACEPTDEESAAFASFTYGGTVVQLDSDAEAVLAALGAYTAFAETNSCYGDGKDKVYQYTSFKVTTYSSRGKDYVLSVEIFNDTDEKACTTEGICIGASTADVIATYGDAKEQSDSALVYVNTATKTRLQFLLRDGKGTNIQYLKSE